MTEIAGGHLLAIPHELERGPQERHTVLLDHMAKHHLWFAAGQNPEEARVNAAWMLTDPSLHRFEVWNGGRFAGMLLLSDITPKCNAVFHFTLLPNHQTGTTLFGARKLLWNFLGYAFEAFQLQRLSAEVPENAPTIARFLRQRLGFRFEGENDTERLLKNRGIVRLDVPGANTWIASHGSRREQAHWTGDRWADVLLLRLMRSEYSAWASLGAQPQTTRDNPVRDSHVAQGLRQGSGEVGGPGRGDRGRGREPKGPTRPVWTADPGGYSGPPEAAD